MNCEKFKDAKYPCATTRGNIMFKYVDREKIHHDAKQNTRYDIALRITSDLSTAFDKYLFRQYYLRDEAVKALDAGDIDTAKDLLHQIGMIEG